jgi:hypothetical protein
MSFEKYVSLDSDALVESLNEKGKACSK